MEVDVRRYVSISKDDNGWYYIIRYQGKIIVDQDRRSDPNDAFSSGCSFAETMVE